MPMNQSGVAQIEETFSRLSHSEQLLLIERLVHRAYQITLKQGKDWDRQLGFMSADPEIQSELDKIEHEFADTEADLLSGSIS